MLVLYGAQTQGQREIHGPSKGLRINQYLPSWVMTRSRDPSEYSSGKTVQVHHELDHADLTVRQSLQALADTDEAFQQHQGSYLHPDGFRCLESEDEPKGNACHRDRTTPLPRHKF